ncbi:MAG: hypothetical protein IJ083_13240 [Clostridia bacterium]|nr:hypothetical protein [Clostridia bacterium]
MTESMEDARIRSALNRTMSGMKGNPYLARLVIYASRETTKGKSGKLSLVMILSFVLLLMTVTAFALHMNALTGNKLYLQLLPVYAWARDGCEIHQGCPDAPVIEIDIQDLN